MSAVTSVISCIRDHYIPIYNSCCVRPVAVAGEDEVDRDPLVVHLHGLDLKTVKQMVTPMVTNLNEVRQKSVEQELQNGSRRNRLLGVERTKSNVPSKEKKCLRLINFSA